jgi:hypothetical protein
MQPKPSIVLVDPMLVDSRSLPEQLDIFFFEPDNNGKRAPGAPLAECTVAHVRSLRIAVHAIPNLDTDTPALMNLRHWVNLLPVAPLMEGKPETVNAEQQWFAF